MTAPHPHVRPFRLADYDAVLALWHATTGVGTDQSDSRESIALFLDRNPDLSLVAAMESGQIVGAVLCGHDGRRGYLHHLAVDTKFRRSGLGKALVETCLANLAGLGLQKCNILVFGHNASGREFWLKRGWYVREDLVVVQKPLL